jgi:hypothetical protein
LIEFGLLVLEKKILKKYHCIFTLSLLSPPWRRDISFVLDKLESHPPKDDLCQVSLNLAQCFWRKRFLNDPSTFLHLCDYLPFEEDMTLYLNKLEFPSSKDNLS